MGELLQRMSATAFMLRFTLSSPDIHTTIVGHSALPTSRRTLRRYAAGRCQLPCIRKPASPHCDIDSDQYGWSNRVHLNRTRLGQ
jgi:hypothetical protein